jgi:hypothetical protein
MKSKIGDLVSFMWDKISNNEHLFSILFIEFNHEKQNTLVKEIITYNVHLFSTSISEKSATVN